MPCDCKICAFDKAFIHDFIQRVFGVDAIMVTEETHLSDFGWDAEARANLATHYGLDLPETLGDEHYLWQVLALVKPDCSVK